MTKSIIRVATSKDCTEIMRLIQELADYEKMPDGPRLDVNTFIEDGFGEEPFYKCFVAEVPDDTSNVNTIVGYCLYYYTYSTWEGKSIYMEDLYVTPKYRHQGIGQSLWKYVVKEGLKRGCSRTDFAVLGWNRPSIEFYKKKGAIDLTETEDWHMFRMLKDKMVEFSES